MSLLRIVVYPFAFWVAVAVAAEAASYECQYSAPMDLYNGNLFLEQVRNNEAGTYMMRLTYRGGQSWIGIGINSQGQSKMTPATAVIGRASDDGSGTSVLHYNLGSDASDGSGVQPLASATLQNARFTQSSTESILEFTHGLNEMGVTDDSTWIFAVGLPNNQWAGKHAIHGSFRLALTDACQNVEVVAAANVATTPPVTPAPVVAPTLSPVTPSTAAPVSSSTTATYVAYGDGDEEESEEDEWEEPEYEFEDEEEGEDESQEDDWVQEDEEYFNTESAAEPVPQQVGQETTSTSTSTTSTTTTSSVASSSGQLSSSSSNSIVFQDTTHPYRKLWMAHGIVLVVAWGVCAPLAIGASLLRNLIGKYLGKPLNWYSLHYYGNMAAILLTLLGFSMAVVATQLEGKNKHFSLAGSDANDSHHKVGLAIVILVVLQGAAGYFRPGLPKPVEKAVSKSLEGMDVEANQERQTSATAESAPSKSASSNTPPPPPETAAAAPQPNNNKSMLRLSWEWSHRLLGMALLGMAWYNCHTGIQWQLKNWEDSKDWTGIFWGIAVGITGSIVVLSYGMRLHSSS